MVRRWLVSIVAACASCASASQHAATAYAPAPLPSWAVPAATPVRASTPATVLEAPTTIERTVRIAPEAPADRLALALGRGGRRSIGTLNFRGAPADDAIRMLAEVGGFNVVVDRAAAGARVTLSLHDVTVLEAVHALLAVAHLDADVLEGNVIRVVPEASGRGG